MDFIKSNNINIGVSLDGPKSINDKHRFFENKDISVYDNVIDKIKMLKKENIAFSPSITITEDVLKNAHQFLNWIKDLQVDNINFNLLHFTNLECDIENYYQRATDFLIMAFENLKKNNIVDGRIQRKINCFVNHKLKFSDCAASSCNQITIMPDGSIGTCHVECVVLMQNVKNG